MPEKMVMRQMAAPYFKASSGVVLDFLLQSRERELLKIRQKNWNIRNRSEFTGNMTTDPPISMEVLIELQHHS